ncbi:hypothetical protein [Kitasatospora sp. HPMI-4]|uniref:hypothetical protein n=1 Tax=Kitasatospora sp. HPMI-4 TaxID=3448443 RepID=UPI003F194495
MSLPLFSGHVLVCLQGGAESAVGAVFDVLEQAFPTHTGRGRNRVSNVWEAPPCLTPEGTWTVTGSGLQDSRGIPGSGPAVVSSQAFDTRDSTEQRNPVSSADGITADLLGAPDDVETMVRVLAELFRAGEQSREEQGPYVEVRLRLGSPSR